MPRSHSSISSSSEDTEDPSVPSNLISRHERFYFPDGSVILQVEKTLFRVQRSLLCLHLPVFADLFSLPQPENTEVEGLADENPIVLEGVESKDFALMLAIFYPSNFDDTQATGGPHTTEEWTSVLALAAKYNSTGLQNLAARKLEPIAGPVKKIQLAHQYAVAEAWLQPSYVDLCVRAERLTVEEGRHLTQEDLVIICYGRETVAAARENGYYEEPIDGLRKTAVEAIAQAAERPKFKFSVSASSAATLFGRGSARGRGSRRGGR